MAFKKYILSLTLILSVISCAHKKVASVGDSLQVAEIKKEESPNVFKVKNLGNCQGCVRGAFTLESKEEEDNQKKVYKLGEQTDYNLKNTHFDFPVTYNKATQKWIKYFVGRGRNSLLRYLELSGRYAPLMAEMLDERSLPRDLIFLAMAESGFQNQAKSHAKAVGPWQFISPTAKKFGLKINWYVDERRDPIKATVAASTYLRDLSQMFGSWELAAAAYNAGEGKISRAMRRFASDDFWKISQKRFLKSETRNYVPKIMALAIIGKNLDSFGLEAIEFKDTLEFELVTIPPLTDLIALSENVGWDLDDLQLWNPELTRWFSPPGLEYHLRTPLGLADSVNKYISEISNKQINNFQTVKLDKGKSLSEISRQYRVPSEVLHDLNESLSEKNYIKSGQEVVLPFRIGQHGKERMYADLYEKALSRKSRRNFRDHISSAKKKGKIALSGKEVYTVKTGDTLWDVSRRTGVVLETLIRANLNVVEDGLRPGEKLVIR